MSLYPLKFKPRFVEKIWGGRKIETVLGKARHDIEVREFRPFRRPTHDFGIGDLEPGGAPFGTARGR